MTTMNIELDPGEGSPCDAYVFLGKSDCSTISDELDQDQEGDKEKKREKDRCRPLLFSSHPVVGISEQAVYLVRQNDGQGVSSGTGTIRTVFIMMEF
jgi:hypothetical protein